MNSTLNKTKRFEVLRLILVGMNSELRVAHEDAIRAVKKQRLCDESTRTSIDALITQIQSTLTRIRSNEVHSLQDELRQLQDYIDHAELLKKMNKDTREFHASISKLGKVSRGVRETRVCSRSWRAASCLTSASRLAI